jgi:hypothetical protein
MTLKAEKAGATVFMQAVTEDVLARFSAAEILARAKKIRSQCHSGYHWNVPERWEDVSKTGRDIWLTRAMVALYHASKQPAPESVE